MVPLYLLWHTAITFRRNQNSHITHQISTPSLAPEACLPDLCVERVCSLIGVTFLSLFSREWPSVESLRFCSHTQLVKHKWIGIHSLEKIWFLIQMTTSSRLVSLMLGTSGSSYPSQNSALTCYIQTISLLQKGLTWDTSQASFCLAVTPVHKEADILSSHNCEWTRKWTEAGKSWAVGMACHQRPLLTVWSWHSKPSPCNKVISWAGSIHRDTSFIQRKTNMNLGGWVSNSYG